jgi:hypothetical protein
MPLLAAMTTREEDDTDTDMGLYPTEAVIHYKAVDQEDTVLTCMNIRLEVVDIHKTEEGKGTDKENSPISRFAVDGGTVGDVDTEDMHKLRMN